MTEDLVPIFVLSLSFEYLDESSMKCSDVWPSTDIPAPRTKSPGWVTSQDLAADGKLQFLQKALVVTLYSRSGLRCLQISDCYYSSGRPTRSVNPDWRY